MRIGLAVTLLALLPALTGCGTYLTQWDGPYSGIRMETKLISDGVAAGPSAYSPYLSELSFWPLALIDLPISFVGDTLLLPITLPVEMIKRREDDGKRKEIVTDQPVMPVTKSVPADVGTWRTSDPVATPPN